MIILDTSSLYVYTYSANKADSDSDMKADFSDFYVINPNLLSAD